MLKLLISPNSEEKRDAESYKKENDSFEQESELEGAPAVLEAKPEGEDEILKKK